MNITAETALAAINANEATIAGWTRNAAGNRVAILTNHKYCRTDHAECGNKIDETESQQRLEQMTDKALRLGH